MTPEEVDALFTAMDADKPETVNAALDHMRENLGCGACPMCFGAVRRTLIKGVPAWACLSCPFTTPLMPEGDTALISDQTRRAVVKVLFMTWELSRG